jgi:hypothetical protein
MKKILPYIFPAVAVLLVIFLGYRWYSSQTAKSGEISPFGEGVQIEDLSTNDQTNLIKGVGDYKTVELSGEGEAMGEIRYELKDGKARFSIMAYLPELTEGSYEVWLKKEGSEEVKKAFALEAGKGGFVGSAAIDESLLPVEVIVSRELRPDLTLEQVVLRGTLVK